MEKYIRMVVFIGLIITIVFLLFRLQSNNTPSESDRQLFDDIRDGDSEFEKLNTELNDTNNQLTAITEEYNQYRINTGKTIKQLQSELVRSSESISNLENERDELQKITGKTSEATRRIRETLEQIKTQPLD